MGALYFYLNSLHLNGKGLGRSALNLKLKIYKFRCQVEPVNYDYDKQMLQENTSNLQSQKNLIYEFSAIDKAATEEEDVKSSLGTLKLRKI